MAAKRIVKSIWITVVVLLLVQATVFAAVVIARAVPLRGNLWFPPVVVAFHVAMGIALAAVHALFRRVEDNTLLDRVNLPNVLSMTRVSSTPTILWLILIADEYSVVPFLATLTALVFLTDLLDGQISRRTHQVTEIGKYLDSSSDYAILFVTSIALEAYGLISLWIFVLIVVRLVFQLIAQSIILIVQRWTITAKSSLLGKAAVFAVMFFYAAALLQLLPSLPEWYVIALQVLHYVVGAIVVVSLVEKAYLFVVDLRTRRRQPS